MSAGTRREVKTNTGQRPVLGHRTQAVFFNTSAQISLSRRVLEPFRHAHSSDKEHQANNQEQEKEKFRNSRRDRGNPGKPKERSYQRNHQKNNSPTQHNNPPPFPDSGITAMLRARCGEASSCEPGPSRTGGSSVAGAPPSTWD